MLPNSEHALQAALIAACKQRNIPILCVAGAGEQNQQSWLEHVTVSAAAPEHAPLCCLAVASSDARLANISSRRTLAAPHACKPCTAQQQQATQAACRRQGRPHTSAHRGPERFRHRSPGTHRAPQPAEKTRHCGGGGHTAVGGGPPMPAHVGGRSARQPSRLPGATCTLFSTEWGRGGVPERQLVSADPLPCRPQTSHVASTCHLARSEDELPWLLGHQA